MKLFVTVKGNERERGGGYDRKYYITINILKQASKKKKRACVQNKEHCTEN